MQRCPSGLRGWFQAPLSSDSWVRIPLFAKCLCGLMDKACDF